MVLFSYQGLEECKTKRFSYTHQAFTFFALLSYAHCATPSAKEKYAGDADLALKDKSQEDLEAHGSVLSYRYVALSEAFML